MAIKLNRFGKLFIASATLIGLVYILGWSSLITIQGVEITGTNQKQLVTAQLLAGESDLVINQPLARINPKHEENLIEDLEWIKSAKVTRNWLNRRVTVQVTPRIPVAVFSNSSSTSGEPRYLASDGSDFSSPAKFTNLATISLVGADSDRLKQRRIVATFVASLPLDLTASLRNLEIKKSGEIIMATDLRKPALRINWGSGNSPEEIVVKSNVLKGLLNLPENKKITFADLTIATSPIVK